jgi:hypothetical protein
MQCADLFARAQGARRWRNANTTGKLARWDGLIFRACIRVISVEDGVA